MEFRNVRASDLPSLIQIEDNSFSKEEAATPEALRQRIEIIPDTFVIAEVQGTIAGYINGPAIQQRYITDDLFETIRPNPDIGGYLSVLGLVVAPDFRHKGLAGELLTYFENLARQQQRHGVTLTCRVELVGFYESYGYRNEGKSESTHGGTEWYNLVKEL